MSIPKRRTNPPQSPEQFAERLLVHDDPPLAYSQIEELTGLARETVIGLERGLIRDGIAVPKRSHRQLVTPHRGRPSLGGVPGRGTIRALAEDLLRSTDANGKGLSFDRVLELVREAFPGRSTLKSVHWYAQNMRSTGERLPPRPRWQARSRSLGKSGPAAEQPSSSAGA